MIRILPFLIPLAVFLMLFQPSNAGLVVTDPTLIATNKAHHAKDLTEQLLRKANQEKQLLRLLEQVSQMDDYLKRYGHPGISVADPEVRRLIDLLRATAPSASSEEINEGVDGAEVFKPSGSSVYTPHSREIILDGQKAAERDPEFYKEDAAAKRGFDHYRSVRQEVLQRRTQLRKSVASTTAQLQSAETESEVRKLTGFLIGQQTELSAIDQEIGFASAEMMARHLEAEAERRLRAKARLEEDRARHRQAMRKDAEFYQLLTTPTYFRARR